MLRPITTQIVAMIFIVLGLIAYYPESPLTNISWFDSNAMLNQTYIIIGALLLISVYYSQVTQVVSLFVGAVMVLVGLLGVLSGGQIEGLFLGVFRVAMVGHIFHIVCGSVLIGLGFWQKPRVLGE